MAMKMLILKPFSVDLTQQKKSQVKKLFAETSECEIKTDFCGMEQRQTMSFVHFQHL
jgi:hypothetical protein